MTGKKTKTFLDKLKDAVGKSVSVNLSSLRILKEVNDDHIVLTWDVGEKGLDIVMLLSDVKSFYVME